MIKCQTEEWYKARIGKFTASGFGNIMSVPSNRNAVFSKKALLYIEKAAAQIYYNNYYYKSDNEASLWGQTNEIFALKEFSTKTGLKYSEAGFINHKEISDIGCTPDAYIIENNNKVIAEIKCPFNPKNHLKYKRKISDKETLRDVNLNYYWQMQGEIFISEVEYGYFISFDPRTEGNKRIHIVKVMRDDRAISFLKNKLLMTIDIRNEILNEFKTNKKIPQPLEKYR